MKFRCTVLTSLLVTGQAFTPLHLQRRQPQGRTKASFLSPLSLAKTQDNWNSLTVPELKEELRSRGLKVGGNKSALIDRLVEYPAEESEGEVEEVDTDVDIETVDDTVDVQAENVEGTEIESKNGDNDDDDDDFFNDRESFQDLGIIEELLASVESHQQWYDPTPIQKLAIPEILNQFHPEIDNRNSLWAEAPTGSGKTGAFALPMIQLTLEHNRLERNRILATKKNANKNRNNNKNKGFVSTLILSPTRELAMQIGDVVGELVKGMAKYGRSRNLQDLDVLVITGGVPRDAQVRMLAERKQNGENVDILIATPGRLADVLTRSSKEDTVDRELETKLLMAMDQAARGSSKNDVSLSLEQLEQLEINSNIAEGNDGGRSAIRDMLSNVQYLVLDEADRLLSQGFKGEMDDVLQLLPKSSGSLKTLLFSATFPEQIEPRVESVLQRLGGKDAPAPLRLSCNAAGLAPEEEEALSNRQQKRKSRTTQPKVTLEGPASTISLRSIRIDERDRTQALRRLLGQYGTEEWDRVLVFVDTRYGSEHVARKLRRYDIRAAELHGKLDQDARIRRLEDFKKGKIRVLIATDLASRGLDVQGLPAVVNYDLPRSTADFVHRIGRTGRAGNKGTAVTFITSTNEAHYNLIEKRHLGKEAVEREVLAGFEPNENKWDIKRAATTIQVSGVKHSDAGLAHDRMFGGIKGKRKSKKDRLREKAAKEAAKQAARKN